LESFAQNTRHSRPCFVRSSCCAISDPLTGHAPEADYEALFTHIVGIVPAPIGLGTVASLPNNPSPFFWRHKELS